MNNIKGFLRSVINELILFFIKMKERFWRYSYRINCLNEKSLRDFCFLS